MPVEVIRLVLEPDGFFDRNPALDVPDPAVARGGGSCCSA
jgi:primary-amine oxidase